MLTEQKMLRRIRAANQARRISMRGMHVAFRQLLSTLNQHAQQRTGNPKARRILHHNECLPDATDTHVQPGALSERSRCS